MAFSRMGKDIWNRKIARLVIRVGVGIFIALILLPFNLQAGHPCLRLHIIDVGEGDAIYLEYPGHCNFLIDTGNLKTGIKVLSYLAHRGANHLDHLILTHPHLDHIGGSFLLIPSLPIHHIYDNGEPLGGQGVARDIYRWYGDLARKHPGYSALQRGDLLQDPPLRIRVLWPPHPTPTKDWNTNSLVLAVSFGSFRCLLMGDANVATERALLSLHPYPSRVQILKAGHHGAEDTLSPSFLAAVSPETVVISVDRNNTRGYPSKKILERIEKSGAKLLRTDRRGTITFTIHPDGTYQVFTEKP